MEGQDYLNQISAKAQPVKQTKGGGILHSKFFLVGMIGLIVLILIIVLGAILGGNKGSEKTLSIKLELHLSATSDVVKTYQPDVKSSQLRSNSASLKTILLDTDKALKDYLTEKYDYKTSNADKKLVEKATAEKETLDKTLFEAKINGELDRVFAQKMAYEITIILNEEAKILRATKNSTLQEIINQSYNSLKILYDKFNDFSEAS